MRKLIVPLALVAAIFATGCMQQVVIRDPNVVYRQLKEQQELRVKAVLPTATTSNALAKRAILEWAETMGLITSPGFCPQYKRFFITKTKHLRTKKKFTLDFKKIVKAQKLGEKELYAVTWTAMEMALHMSKGGIKSKSITGKTEVLGYKYKKCIGRVAYTCRVNKPGQLDAKFIPRLKGFSDNTSTCRSRALRITCGEDVSNNTPDCQAWRKKCVIGFTLIECNSFRAVCEETCKIVTKTINGKSKQVKECKQYEKDYTHVSLPGFLHVLKQPDRFHQLCTIPARAYFRQVNEQKFDQTQGKWYYPAFKFPQIVKTMAMFYYDLKHPLKPLSSGGNAYDDDDDDNFSSTSNGPRAQFKKIVDRFKYASHWQRKYVELYRKRTHLPDACGLPHKQAVKRAFKLFRKTHRHILLAAIAYAELQYQVFLDWYARKYATAQKLAQKSLEFEHKQNVEKHLKAAYALLYKADGSKTNQHTQATKALSEDLIGRTYEQTYKSKDPKNPKKVIEVKKAASCAKLVKPVRIAWSQSLDVLRQIAEHRTQHIAYVGSFTQQRIMLARATVKSSPKGHHGSTMTTHTRTVTKTVKKHTSRKAKPQTPQYSFKAAPQYVLDFLKQ